MSDPPGFVKTVACQGMYGAGHSKETEFRGSVALSRAHTKCERTWRWWRKPSSSYWHLGSHPPLRGKLRTVPADDWEDDEYRWRVAYDMEFLTRKTAAYTWDLNLLLADTPVLKTPKRFTKRPATPRPRSPELLWAGLGGNSLSRAVASEDPGVEVASWARLGPPVCIRCHSEQVGVFSDSVSEGDPLVLMLAEADDPILKSSYAAAKAYEHAEAVVLRLRASASPSTMARGSSTGRTPW